MTGDLNEKGSASRLRLRAVALGLLFAVLIVAVTPFNNTYRQGTLLGGGHFPLAPFFILLWLTLLAGGLNRVLAPRKVLNGRELLTIWMLMVLVSGIAYTGLLRTFFINVTAPYHFATAGNDWQQVLHPLLPQAWYPQDPAAIQSLYDGIPGGHRLSWMEVLRRIPWTAWAGPLALWGGFVLLCYFVMICVINVFSAQWVENERMNFPLLRVPILMEEALDENSLGGFFGNRFLLAGVFIPVCLHLLNGLHFYNPSVPDIPTLILAGSYFPKVGLLSGFYKLKIYFYPAFIGFAFLASRQISFSFWLFFILGTLLIGLLSVLGYNIPSAALGITFGPTLSRPEETQMIGAFGVFFLFLVWLSRQHLKGVIRQALFLDPPDHADAQLLPLRFSAWGAFAGIIAIAWFLHHFGMGLLASILFVLASFMVLLVATRVICQGGVAYFTLTAAPLDGMMALFGVKFFAGAGLVLAAVVQKVLFLDLRESLMPSLLHAGKIKSETRSGGLFSAGVGVVLVVGLVAAFGAMLALCYRYGIRELSLDWATGTTLSVYDNLATLVKSPQDPGHWVVIFAVVGALVMLGLVICYHRFYWWPIHPVGYLMAYSSAMRILWFSFFVGWAANALCMRYGGVALFKKLRLFFIGLIIGDFLMGGAFALYGLFADASYQVLPT